MAEIIKNMSGNLKRRIVMKNLLKLLVLVLCIVCVSALFTGCAGKGDKLIVATNAEFPPFETKNVSTDELEGFDIDLINEIAKKLGVEVEFKNMDFKAIVGSVQSGASDVSVSGMSITEERLKSVDFSEAYYNASQVAIVKNDDTVFANATTKEAIDELLKGKKIGVCAGFTGGDYVEGSEAFPGIEGATKKSYDNINLAVIDLQNGAIDVIIMDDVVAKKAASRNKDSVKVIDVALSTEQYGIAIGKNDAELKGKIDKALQELKEEGFIDSLIRKWIEE